MSIHDPELNGRTIFSASEVRTHAPLDVGRENWKDAKARLVPASAQYESCDCSEAFTVLRSGYVSS